MPDITVRGTFKPDPSYNHVEEVERSIQMMRKYLDNQLSIIDNIGDQTMQLICMFSLIDCLAQEWAGYPTGKSKEAFCKFVLQHQSKYDYLDGVEPVTLHYHVEDLIKESDIEHLLCTIEASDPYGFGRSDGVAAAGADVLSAA